MATLIGGFRFEEGNTAEVTVPATGSPTIVTVIATITNERHSNLKFQCNVRQQNLNTFMVWARGPGSPAILMPITPASWATLPAGGDIIKTAVHTTSTGAFIDGDLHTIDTGQSGFFDMNIQGYSVIVVMAGAAANNALVLPMWTKS